MVPTVVIALVKTVKLAVTLLQLATPVEAFTSITSPLPIVWPYPKGSND